MLKKFLAAVLVAAASFTFTATSEAAESDYTCRGGCYGDGYCYDDGYCYGNDNRGSYGGNYRGGCHGVGCRR
ncbi:MAG: hypothetical protein IJU91_05515 [Selenomonadaceae bacterium]|nr:hypothetical protein [Selenomonadaceae bacterium]